MRYVRPVTREADPDKKPALLQQVVDYLADKPLSALTFRGLATGLGVSSFTLVYHFGTRADLVCEIIRSTAGTPRSKADSSSTPFTASRSDWSSMTTTTAPPKPSTAPSNNTTNESPHSAANLHRVAGATFQLVDGRLWNRPVALPESRPVLWSVA